MIKIVSKLFGHSSSAQTLDYIGITNDEMTASYLDLNLGGHNCYAKFSRVNEVEIPKAQTPSMRGYSA